jgi:hypothetical protein
LPVLSLVGEPKRVDALILTQTYPFRPESINGILQIAFHYAFFGTFRPYQTLPQTQKIAELWYPGATRRTMNEEHTDLS